MFNDGFSQLRNYLVAHEENLFLRVSHTSVEFALAAMVRQDGPMGVIGMQRRHTRSAVMKWYLPLVCENTPESFKVVGNSPPVLVLHIPKLARQLVLPDTVAFDEH